MTQVIVLNGGSSSGKSSIARVLQDVLPGQWLTFGTDVLAEALPGRGEDPRSGLVLEPDGAVTVKPEFRAVEEIWYQGLAVMASRGAFLILDEVFLAGGAGQRRLRALLGDLDVLWAGAHCDPLVAPRPLIARKNSLPAGSPCRSLAYVLPRDHLTADARSGRRQIWPPRRRYASGFSERGDHGRRQRTS
jgi:chloramphenicol 3-O-phosphotransferase